MNIRVWFSSLSLTQKINGLCFASLLVTGGVNAYHFSESQENLKQATFSQLSGEAERLGEAVASQLFERYGDVQAFSKNSVLQPGNKKTDMVEALNTYVKLYGIYEQILLVDFKGHLIATNSVGPDGKALNVSELYEWDYKKFDWFIKTVSGKTTDDKDAGYEGTNVENPAVDPIVSLSRKEEFWGNGFSTPFKDRDGRVIGVISTRANLKWIENEMSSVFSTMVNSGKWGEIALVGQNGLLLSELAPGETEKTKNAKEDWSPNRDFGVLGKLNLLEKGVGGVKEVLAGQTGYTFTKHLRKGIDQVAAYAPLSGKKSLKGLGWGFLVRSDQASLLAPFQKTKWVFFFWMSVTGVLVQILAYLIAKVVGSEFLSVARSLTLAVKETEARSTELSQASQTVSDSSTEQSSAIQESVSALSEISSMIKQTAENSNESLKAAENVSQRTEKGRETMRELTLAMTGIDEANAQLQAISKVIEDISNRTQVINDIVLKTQLLSFNASIEAARAGQHGRGFAVVAEEVGSLAMMSGNAAKEIEALLANSQSQVGNTLKMIRERVQQGTRVSNDAVEGFEGIARDLQAVNSSIKMIAEATRQQEEGILQTTTAMTQMDQSSQKNSAAADQAAATANALQVNAESLSEANFRIQQLVLGQRVGKLAEKAKETNPEPFGASKRRVKAAHLLGPQNPSEKPAVTLNSRLNADSDLFRRTG